eukprot:5901633-Pleurochrysis_carterae.AAC.3
MSPASGSKSKLNSVLGHERAEEGGDIGRYVECLGCTPSRAQRAWSSFKWPRLHASAMGLAAPKTWRTWSCGFEERNACMACKYSSARGAASSFALSSARWKVAKSESNSSTTQEKWRKKAQTEWARSAGCARGARELFATAKRQRREVVVRKPRRLPPQQLPACEGCGANEDCRDQFTAQVMAKAMHPRGRPYPHSSHVFEQLTQLAQRRGVRTVGEHAHGWILSTALTALLRGRKSTRGSDDEDYS